MPIRTSNGSSSSNRTPAATKCWLPFVLSTQTNRRPSRSSPRLLPACMHRCIDLLLLLFTQNQPPTEADHVAGPGVRTSSRSAHLEQKHRNVTPLLVSRPTHKARAGAPLRGWAGTSPPSRKIPLSAVSRDWIGSRLLSLSQNKTKNKPSTYTCNREGPADQYVRPCARAAQSVKTTRKNTPGGRNRVPC